MTAQWRLLGGALGAHHGVAKADTIDTKEKTSYDAQWRDETLVVMASTLYVISPKV